MCLAAAVIPTCGAQTNQASKPLPDPVKKILYWLPADTETILVDGKSFVMPQLSASDDPQDRAASPGQVFQRLPLDRFSLKDGLLQNYLAGETVDFAVEGSRHFRNPSALGEALYEGCQIAVLKKASPARGASFRMKSAKVVLKTETIAGQLISVFQEMIENDLWTTLVVFPTPNVVAACTNRDYLREVVERIGGKAGKRALPDTLQEWAFVNTQASFWGLRHYDRSQAGLDPTSPLAGQNVLGVSDSQAIGVTVAFDAERQGKTTISYLSAATNILELLQKRTPLSMHVEGLVPSTENLPVHYRLVKNGVAEIEYELGDAIPAEAFALVMIGVFGHPVYF